MIRQQQWKLLDNFRRKTFIKFELKKQILKSILTNTKLPLTYRYYASFQLSLLPKAGSFTKQRNRCVVSGRN